MFSLKCVHGQVYEIPLFPSPILFPCLNKTHLELTGLTTENGYKASWAQLDGQGNEETGTINKYSSRRLRNFQVMISLGLSKVS